MRWCVSTSPDYFLDGATVIRDGGARGLVVAVITKTEHEAEHAALIVEAVNAYDAMRELVEAAQFAEVRLPGHRDTGEGDACMCAGHVALRAIRAALAKVKG